jgi:hypothetical protein
LSINAQDYQKMWKEYDENISNLLPESAEKVLNNIEKQALKDKNDVQLLKTVLRRSDILNMKEENPEDTIVGYCKSYLPKLSKASQVILNVEIAKFKSKYDDVIGYQDDDFIKTVSMEQYADLFQSENDHTVFDIDLEPTLYDYVMHCLISEYFWFADKQNLYEKLLAFDLENEYTKAYYNNRINQLGQITEKNYDDFTKLADECTDNEFIAKIKIKQIEYMTYMSEFVKAKSLCDETMTLLDKNHPLYLQCVEYIKSLQQKAIEIQLNNVYVPGQPIAVGLKYRNTTNPSYKIFKVSTDEFLKLSFKYNEDILPYILTKKPIVEKTLEIPEETDYKAHSSLIALPALQCGVYYLVFSNNNSFDDPKNLIYCAFQVSNLAMFNLETDENLNLYVVNRETGLPMSFVKAHFTQSSYSHDTKSWGRKTVADVISDRSGFLTAPITKKNTYYIDLYDKNDTLLSEQSFSYYKSTKKDNVEIKSEIFTDRAIYRPGQTVQFNYLAYRGNSKEKEVLPDFQTVVYFRDANSHVIDSLELKTNEFGAAHGSFVIPTDRLNGYFNIRDEKGSVLFKVEEYKRPTFEVTFNAPEKEYKIGDSISVSGKIAALSGFGLDNVTYKYTITRKTSFPFRFWYWVPPYHISDETIATGESITAVDGTFNIDFQLSPSNEFESVNRPKYTYEINVTATNKQGESQIGKYSVYSTYNKYDIRIEGSDIVDVKDLDKIYVTATNISGKSVNTRVEYKIFKINDIERYPIDLGDFDRKILSDALLKAYFPNFDYYAKNDISKEIVCQGVIDVDGKAKLLQDKKLTPAQYIIELRSVDDTLSAFSNKYIVHDIKSKKMPYKSMLWTNIDKTSAQPGENINYYVGSSEKNVSALVIVKKGTQILRTERILLNNNVVKLSYKVREEDRGRIDFQVAVVKYNTEMSHVDYVVIPYNNLDLDVVLHTERNKMLPGEQDIWSLTVKNYKGNPVDAAVMAVMYDAALDNFGLLHWNIYNKPGVTVGSSIKSDRSFSTQKKYQYYHLYYFHYEENLTFSAMNLLPSWYSFGIKGGSINRNIYYCMDDAVEEEEVYMHATSDTEIQLDTKPYEPQEIQPAKIRKDFNETAFFYPNLRTDENGDCTFTFTMPDALTRWNLKILSYSKTLSVGNLEKTIVTQQPLMIMADMPRFAYDEDTLWIAANVINMSDEFAYPEAKLEIFDENGNPVDLILAQDIKHMKVPANQSRRVRWKVAMRKDLGVLTFRFSATTGGFSDAEQHLLPVLSTEVFLTQTYSLTTKANTNEEFEFNIKNEDERNYDVKLNFNANPMFYAIQALPYLADGDEKYAMTVFNRYFTNKMAQEIIANNPNIKEMLDEHEGDTLSELQKYEELKAILLKETPWVLEAKSESQQRANVAKLFDAEAIDKNLASALSILEKKQTVNGGWSWIEGMPESEYITQYILCGLGRLGDNTEMTEKAFHFLENEVITRYKKLDTPKKKKDAICGFMTMQELYAMSYFDYETSDKFNEAKDFFIRKLYSDWRRFSIEEQSYIALILNRNNHGEIAKLVVKSLRERALKNELGMYWRYISVETEARILEAFNEIEPIAEEIDNMRLWILTQKRTNMWENERATVEAIFALMNRGTNWSAESAEASMTVGDDSVKVTVENHSNHVVWGGVFRQYFVPIDKVQKHNDAMKIKRELIIPENVKVGDKVKVEITFENSQDMEFVYLKDLRGACFEPVEQLSRYHWDNGLWYYQSTTDVSMEYFIERLPKGKHTVSYELYVTKDGSFSAGYAQIQCQYAPEFGAYSNGARISVNP